MLSIFLFALVASCDQSNTTNANEEKDVAQQSVGEITFRETISTGSSIAVNEEKVNEAIDKGFPSPVAQYTAKENDTIQYDSQKSSFELGESLRHTGFDGLEIIYEKTEYSWDTFFDELDVTEYNRTITVNLKENSIYESDIVDEYEKYDRYYDEHKGLH